LERGFDSWVEEDERGEEEAGMEACWPCLCFSPLPGCNCSCPGVYPGSLRTEEMNLLSRELQVQSHLEIHKVLINKISLLSPILTNIKRKEGQRKTTEDIH
jgi:hypothetical protein